MDWLGVALSIGGMWLLPKYYKWAIALFILSNFVWTAYGLQGGVWSIIGLQCVFLVLNVRALAKGVQDVKHSE